MADVPVITVDGPSGTGKGTVCGILADTLQWHLLDSGALYRVLAYAALSRNISLDDSSALAALVRELDVRFEFSGGGSEVQIILDSTNVSHELRTEQCGNAASRIAAMAVVRAALLDRQRAFLQPPGLVADGRDMGTVVFPDAPLKIYLIASAEERAKRRYKQLKQKGISANLRQLSADIAERDTRDSKREVSPLKPADDAIMIDTTHLDIPAVMQEISALIKKIFADLPESSRF